MAERLAESPGQVIVRLQYSHNLGGVTRDHLQTLLSSLSNYGEMWLQWTLSAPIFSCSSEKSPMTELPVTASLAATEAPASQFCMTHPASPCIGTWPSCVVKTTDTILIDYWLQGALLTATQLLQLDKFVKATVSSWVKNIIKFQDHIWVVSRLTQQITVSEHVEKGRVSETVTFDKVMAEGQN